MDRFDDVRALRPFSRAFFEIRTAMLKIEVRAKHFPRPSEHVVIGRDMVNDLILGSAKTQRVSLDERFCCHAASGPSW